MNTMAKMSLFLLFFSSLTFADEPAKGHSGRTGNDLLPLCSLAVDLLDKKDLTNAQMETAIKCIEYVSGYADGFTFGQAAGCPVGTEGVCVVCLRSEVSTGQLIRVVVKWLRDHPEKLNEGAPFCVFASLFDAFKCEKKKQKP